jgi:hypothetical protein
VYSYINHHFFPPRTFPYVAARFSASVFAMPVRVGAVAVFDDRDFHVFV